MSQRRRVLWVSTSLATRGGVASYVRTMEATPLWARWSIEHVATHQDGTPAQRLGRFASSIPVIAVHLLLRRPALVHLHSASRGSFARKSLVSWVCRALRVPVVMHIHGGGFADFHDRSPRLLRRYIRATLESAAAVVALGPSWAAQLRRIAPKGRVVVVPNAVSPRPAPTPAPGPDEPVSVLFLGQVSEAKGVFLLLDAWEKVAAQVCVGTSLRLVIAGDGLVEEARQRVHEGGLEDSVEVLGWVSHERVESLLGQCHVLVLPSRWEGQPMAVLEAMAHGLAVVATSVGGIPDLVGASSGVLVPPDDGAALEAALERVLGDPMLRQRLGEGGLATVREKFDVSRTWRALDELYEEITRA